MSGYGSDNNEAPGSDGEYPSSPVAVGGSAIQLGFTPGGGVVVYWVSQAPNGTVVDLTQDDDE